MNLVKNSVKPWRITVRKSKSLRCGGFGPEEFLDHSIETSLNRIFLVWIDSFGQTLFSRFVKEMVVVTDADHDGRINKREMRNMLRNIGVDQSVSEEDLDAVFAEIGHEEDGEHFIYIDEIQSILTQPSSLSQSSAA